MMILYYCDILNSCSDQGHFMNFNEDSEDVSGTVYGKLSSKRRQWENFTPADGQWLRVRESLQAFNRQGPRLANFNIWSGLKRSEG